MTDRLKVWMPLYIGDYLADTSRLTTEQHGAYLLIIMDYWRNGAPPDDDEILSSIAKLQLAQWKRHARVVSEFFTVIDGRWMHKRIEAEKRLTRERQAAGKAGARKRWQTHSKAMANRVAKLGSKPIAKRC